MLQSFEIKNLIIELAFLELNERNTRYTIEKEDPQIHQNNYIIFLKRQTVYEEMRKYLKGNLESINKLKSILTDLKTNTHDKNLAFYFCNSIEENVFLKN